MNFKVESILMWWGYNEKKEVVLLSYLDPLSNLKENCCWLHDTKPTFGQDTLPSIYYWGRILGLPKLHDYKSSKYKQTWNYCLKNIRFYLVTIMKYLLCINYLLIIKNLLKWLCIISPCEDCLQIVAQVLSKHW